METTTTEEAVKAAQAPGVFDVLAFVEGTAYPTESVTVYQDAKSATEYVKLVEQRFELDKLADNSKNTTEDDISARIEALGEKLAKSAIHFELRGMPPGIVAGLLKVAEGEEPELNEQARDNALISKTIIKVSNADGAEDARVWQAEDVAKLRNFLKEGEFGKLVQGVGNVNFNAMVFDQATDAGFSG